MGKPSYNGKQNNKKNDSKAHGIKKNKGGVQKRSNYTLSAVIKNKGDVTKKNNNNAPGIKKNKGGGAKKNNFNSPDIKKNKGAGSNRKKNTRRKMNNLDNLNLENDDIVVRSGQRRSEQQKQKVYQLTVYIPRGLWYRSHEVIEKIEEKCKGSCNVGAITLKMEDKASLGNIAKGIRQICIDGSSLIIPQLPMDVNFESKKEKNEFVPFRRTFAIQSDYTDLESVRRFYNASKVNVVKDNSAKNNLKICALTFPTPADAEKAGHKVMTIDGLSIKLGGPPPLMKTGGKRKNKSMAKKRK